MNWIKLDASTPDKPAVAMMAATLRCDPDLIVGKLVRVWIWADTNTAAGQPVPVSDAFLDRLARRRGFSAAMRAAGWLDGPQGAAVFPDFERHNGPTARARASTARRVAEYRIRNGASVTPPLQSPPQTVTDCNGASVTESVTEPLPEREIEEEPSPPYSPPPSVSYSAATEVQTPGGDGVFEVWNGSPPLPAIAKVTAKRKTALRARMADPFFRDHWREGIARVVASPFLTGSNRRDWIADIDWFLRPDTIVKVMEGRYNDPAPKPVPVLDLGGRQPASVIRLNRPTSTP